MRGCPAKGRGFLVRARTPDAPVPCPSCGALSGRVHGCHLRTVADAPVDGRRVAVRARVRRVVCTGLGAKASSPPHPHRTAVRSAAESEPGALNRHARARPHRSLRRGFRCHGTPPATEHAEPQTTTAGPAAPGTSRCSHHPPPPRPHRPRQRQNPSAAPNTAEQTRGTTKIPTDHEDQRDLVNCPE
ncbi:transposase family protein [Streptomyces caeni]|uniref:Transposase family protein n=1 Tax=Streptomyces caeni TaxID=2307231 RepID=A0ABW4J036_9ACTN